jgi:hypothetical protein
MPDRPSRPVRAAFIAPLLVGLSVGLLHAAERDAEPVARGPAELLSTYARQQLSSDPKGHGLRVLALNQALETQLLSQAAAAVSDAQVSAYYERHRVHFQKPEAISLWRLLLPTESRAKELLTKIRTSADPARTWASLVREYSLDKATHFRRGALGFVWADGNTDVPQVRVSPGLYAAAKGLADGELCHAPIKEGDNWALIWRRDTRPAVGRSLSHARDAIRQQLSLAAARDLHNKLTQELRAQHLTEYHPEHVDHYLSPPELPSQIPPKAPLVPQPALASPVPRVTDFGER